MIYKSLLIAAFLFYLHIPVMAQGQLSDQSCTDIGAILKQLNVERKKVVDFKTKLTQHGTVYSSKFPLQGFEDIEVNEYMGGISIKSVLAGSKTAGNKSLFTGLIKSLESCVGASYEKREVSSFSSTQITYATKDASKAFLTVFYSGEAEPIKLYLDIY